MAIHWTIAFKSLRTGTDYRVNIYDANYSGSSSIHLKGAAEPFTTEEESMTARTRTEMLSIGAR